MEEKTVRQATLFFKDAEEFNSNFKFRKSRTRFCGPKTQQIVDKVTGPRNKRELKEGINYDWPINNQKKWERNQAEQNFILFQA